MELPSVGARALLLAGFALLCACPQDIYGPDGGMPPDAAFEPPKCAAGGPEFSCTPAHAGTLAVMDVATFTCTVPTGRAVRFAALQTDHPELSFGFDPRVSDATATVGVQLKPVTDKGFADTTVRFFLTLVWDDDPKSCTIREVQARWAGNVWVADPDNGRVVVLSSQGKLVGDLALEGLSQPRLLAAIPDGILAGGLEGASDALAVYGHGGDRRREVPETGAVLANKPLRAAAEMGSYLFVSTGVGPDEGALYRATTGALEKQPRQVAGLWGGDGQVLAGLSQGKGYLRLTPGDPSGGDPLYPDYRDTATRTSCEPRGTTAIVRLSNGDHVFALRHPDKTGLPTLGMLVRFNAGAVIQAQTAHDHTGLPGHLAIEGAYDWLEELVPGVLLGTRDGKPGIERIDVTAIGQSDAAEAWGELPRETLPRGLVRLR